MNPMYSLQDVIRCGLCETPVPSKHCDVCHIHLCDACEWDHLSDKSKDHIVVPFKMRGSTPECQMHPTKLCKLLCEQCNIPVCDVCASSDEHEHHSKDDIQKILACKRELIQKDLEEYENFIYPQYKDAASDIPGQRGDAIKRYEELTAALGTHGENWQTEVDTLIHRMQSKVYEMKVHHIEFICNQEYKMNNTIKEINEIIDDLKRLLETSDVCLFSKYKSRNAEFRKLPSKLYVSLPTFTPEKIDKDFFEEHFGFLKNLSIKTEEHHSLYPAMPLIKNPQIIGTMKTGYQKYELSNVSHLSDSKFWTSGENEIIRLYNIHGELLKSVKTISGKFPSGIAVTSSRDLVYTDHRDRSINTVTNMTTRVQPLIRLQGWIPRGVCCTSSGDLLVIMDSDDEKQTKVVLFSESKEKKAFQYDNNEKPFYSCDLFNKIKHISENRNFDICVSDSGARAIVVVSAAGEFRFRYTGERSTINASPLYRTKEPFEPRGITTDSQGRILTVDYHGPSIHILDQDGYFLRNIGNRYGFYPWGVCVDSKDTLFVAEYMGKVTKIRYCE